MDNVQELLKRVQFWSRMLLLHSYAAFETPERETFLRKRIALSQFQAAQKQYK